MPGRLAPLKWAGLPAFPVGLRRIGWALPGRWGSAGLVEALPDRWGAAELDGREPSRPAASFFRIFRSAVRAQKPSSLALRAGGANRADRRAPSFGFLGPRFALENRVLWFCGQAGANRAGLRAAFRLKRDARKAPSASVHLFPLLFFQKERIDDEFTLSPRRRQFPPLLRDRSKLEVFHEYLYGGSQQRFRSNSYS